MKQLIPLATDLHIEKFSGTTLTEISHYIRNGIVRKYPDDRMYVTQRPSFTTVDSSATGATLEQGRGIYYWRLANTLYIVNGAEVFTNNYSGSALSAASDSATLTSSSTTATATVTNHGYRVGQSVIIAGATQTEYNGTYTVVTVPTADTFTYTFAGSATSPATGTITATPVFMTGTDRVYWAELADKLMLVDVENNIAWYVADGSPTVLNIIRDANFPDADNDRTLADGTAVLDNTAYVLANVDANTNAEIWGSDLSDITSWSGTNFLTAYKNNDRGVYIGKHLNNIFVLGDESIEFFYNAANPVGSPLAARQDLFYNTGCADGKSVFIDNDVVYFMGKSQTSGLSVYKLENFQLSRISTPSMDSYFNSCIAIENASIIGSGVNIGGEVYYIVTVYFEESNEIVAKETLVFNALTGVWTLWDHASSEIDKFPLVQWVKANSVSGENILTGKGILSNGNVIESYDDLIPQDRVRGSLYVAADYVDDAYVSDISAAGDVINMQIVTSHHDFGTRNKKFMHEARVSGDVTDTSQTLTIQWADDVHYTYFPSRSLDMSVEDAKVTRMGPFRQRTFDLSYAGTEQIRLDNIEVEVEGAGI